MIYSLIPAWKPMRNCLVAFTKACCFFWLPAGSCRPLTRGRKLPHEARNLKHL